MLTNSGIEQAKEALTELEVIHSDIDSLNKIARASSYYKDDRSPFSISTSQIRLDPLPLHRDTVDAILEMELSFLENKKRVLNTQLSDLFHDRATEAPNK